MAQPEKKPAQKAGVTINELSKEEMFSCGECGLQATMYGGLVPFRGEKDRYNWDGAVLQSRKKECGVQHPHDLRCSQCASDEVLAAKTEGTPVPQFFSLYQAVLEDVIFERRAQKCDELIERVLGKGGKPDPSRVCVICHHHHGELWDRENEGGRRGTHPFVTNVAFGVVNKKRGTKPGAVQYSVAGVCAGDRQDFIDLMKARKATTQTPNPFIPLKNWDEAIAQLEEEEAKDQELKDLADGDFV